MQKIYLFIIIELFFIKKIKFNVQYRSLKKINLDLLKIFRRKSAVQNLHRIFSEIWVLGCRKIEGKKNISDRKSNFRVFLSFG
jgi:hypothetical protein